MERTPITMCNEVGCPTLKCECSCHSNLMDHMFACCAIATCEKCGKTFDGVPCDGGVYYKEQKK